MIAPVPLDLEHARSRIEEIPSGERRDRVLDTLSGGLIRLFAQVSALERAYQDERSARLKLAEEVARLAAQLARPRLIERLNPPPRVRNGRPVD